MLKLEDYRLRSITESDLDTVLEWRNSERIRANMYNDHIISKAEHKAWFEKNKKDDSSIYKIFEYKERPIGVVNAIQIDRINNKCYWAFYLGETDIPRGSGAAMEFLFLEDIFENNNIRKLCCEVFSFNISTIKLHKKFGFEEEGCFKHHVLKGEKYEDVVSMALFKEEWINKKELLEKKYFSK